MDIYKNLYSKDENDREINIYKIQNCTVDEKAQYYPSVRLITKRKYMYPIMERIMSLATVSASHQDATDATDATDVTCAGFKSLECPVFFFIYNTENYYHFIYDSLPYLISYLKLKEEIETIKLLVQYPNNQKTSFYPFMLEFLEQLGIHRESLVLVDTVTTYRTIYVSDSYTHGHDSNMPPRDEIYKFYTDIAQKVKLPELEPHQLPNRIYVSRRSHVHGDLSNMGTNYTERRKLVNEDELVDVVKRYGYTEIFTETMSTVEKILLYSQATDVIGCIGGGLVNMVFCPKSTKLTVIVSPTFLDVNSRFRHCLDCVNSFYYHDTKHTEDTYYKTNMRVKYNGGIGEIAKVEPDHLSISWTNDSIAGWDSANHYKLITVNISDDVVPLDKGLNSPFRCNIESIIFHLDSIR